jgi:hypothetical protein
VEPLSIESLAGALDYAFHVSECRCFLYDQQRFNLAEIAVGVKQASVTVIGLSIPIGALNEANRFLEECSIQQVTDFSLVIGGALPTVRPDIILNLFPQAIIVQGYGENSLIGLVKYFMSGQQTNLRLVPNLVYLNGKSRIVSTFQEPSKLTQVPLPRRQFLPAIIQSGGIVNAETSRNCSYAAEKGPCTYCVRDPRFSDPKMREIYDRGTVDRAISDIELMYSLGAREINYVDEEFLGGDPIFANRFADEVTKLNVDIRFLISTRIDSIHSRHTSNQTHVLMLSAINNLRKAGLRRLFVGIESASNSQLRRYHKGYQVGDIVLTMEVLREIGLDVEVGFIMFDPFVTISELRDNLNFLNQTGLWKTVSSITNMLRVSDGGSYLEMVRNAEKKRRTKILETFCCNTLAFGYNFVHPDVSSIVTIVQEWKSIIDRVQYALKSVTRGRFGIPGQNPMVDMANHYLYRIRRLEMTMLTSLVEADQANSNKLSQINKENFTQLALILDDLAIALQTKMVIDSVDLVKNAVDESRSMMLVHRKESAN